MSGYRVAVIPGDGVGAEVATEAVRALDAAADQFGFDVSTESFAWGCDWYLEHGEMMPEDALETLAAFDAIFLGCIGDAGKVADDVSLTMLLGSSGPAFAVLLPQVAADRGWDADELLNQLARKAGLQEDAWRDAELSVFRAEVFGES